ncbi:hypothetical protein OG417_13775 [Actinoallomurus sp. NBC_01490]|uniref:hypothetical protein n=1 Tax=Actinoallomurus sp. NBC_01490 TaxID=2903557 RepID=UPI002E31938B|nr:hypothetical protein [Actinoallomurus sp. NBC_01490]
MSVLSRRRPKCQLCRQGDPGNFTGKGRKLIPKGFCNECEARLKGGERIEVTEKTLKKICQELDMGLDTAKWAAYKLLLLRDPRSADALYAYASQKKRWPASEAGLALAAMDDPRAEPADRDALEVHPTWRVFAPKPRTPEDVCGGIVVARIEAGEKELKLLTLAKDPREAAGQIADLLNYPADHPARVQGPAAVSRPGRAPGLTLFHTRARGGGSHLPEDAILRWDDNYHADKNVHTRNMMASHFAGSTESGATIHGTAVLSGYDVRTGTIRSVPVRTLENDLSMQAYGAAAGYVHAWRKERGL